MAVKENVNLTKNSPSKGGIFKFLERLRQKLKE